MAFLREIGRRRLALILAFSCLSLASAGETAYKFTHFNTSNSGISYDGISKITQDSRGFIWVGTFNGLNRFDGMRFDSYSRTALGLPSDFIHTIVEDGEGNLWIGTDAGCCRYLWREDRFEPFDAQSDQGTQIRNKVTCIWCDAAGTVWFLVNYQGLFRYTPADGVLRNWEGTQESAPDYSPDNLSISFRRITGDENGTFWLSRYHKGLFQSGPGFTDIAPLRPSNAPDFYEGDEIEQLFFLDGALLTVSNLHGLSRYLPASGTVKELFPCPEGVSIVDAFLEKDRFVWMATTGGVWRYDLHGEQVPLSLREEKNDRLSLAGHYVFTCFVDRDSGLWIGTKDGGVSYSGAPQNLVEKQYLCAGEPLDGAVISGLSWDGDDAVWVSGENAPILHYGISSQQLSKVELPALPSPRTFVFWEGGWLWIGTHNGLYRYHPASGVLENKGMLARDGAKDPRVYLASRSPQGDLYFSNTLCLSRYDAETDAFCPVPELDGVFVTSLAWMPDGRNWVSSYAVGLFEWDAQHGKILRRFRYGDGSGLPTDKISSLLTDRQGRLWVIGFNGGFARLDGDTFTVYDRRSVPDLPSDIYFNAVEDENGCLWLSSDKGLVKFNPADASVSVFNEQSGLLDNKMSRSLLRLPSGDIFAGSDNGFIRFRPLAVEVSGASPRVIVLRMRVGSGFYPGNVDLMDQVQLRPGRNSFGFAFSLMDLPVPVAGRLNCLLEGYDDDWRDISVSRSVYYFNVPPGRYRLRLRSSVSGKDWTEAHSPITVVVRPKFLASAAGTTLILLLFVLLGGLFFWRLERRRRARTREEEAEYRRKTDAALLQSKMDFFSHIVHEIKTPLTLIGTPLQSVMAKDSLDDEARRDLSVMKSNTDYLTGLVNELLEFSRVERKGYILNCEPLNLAAELESTVFNYTESARLKGISLNLCGTGEEVWVKADRPALGKMLNNLLINALKYAQSSIEISLSRSGDQVQVDVANDGAKISPEHRESVFHPFVRHDDGREGFGIGLPLARSLARMHGGDIALLDAERTTFRLSLPGIEAPAPQAESLENEEGEGLRDARPVLLIAEDNAELRDFLARKMGDHYTVLTAAAGDEAMDLIRAESPDVVITDITMPGIDGLQLCRSVREDPENSHIPVIVLSARTSVESKIRAMEAGADLYIEKPFDLEYLRTSVRNIVERRSLMRKALSSGMEEADISLFGLPKRDEEFFRTFDNFIKEHLGDSELSNDMIADALCMSQSSMIRKIRKLLDTSPSNYIRTKRLGAAARMLRDAHGNNVTDICYAVGFTSASYFAKCFREKYGVTPSEYALGAEK